MKISFKHQTKQVLLLFLTCVLLGSFPAGAMYQTNQNFNEYKGKVVDSETGESIASAYLQVVGTSISTVTNSEGEFSIKLPSGTSTATITTSSLGYQSKTLPLSFFARENTVIELEPSVEKLSEVAVFLATDAKKLVQSMFEKKGMNYFEQPTEMTAFYRESIQNRRRNISLSEALVTVYKAPYDSPRTDDVSIIKARKRTDYERLDTLALKLRGGPYNPLYVDVMKYPEFLFETSSLEFYEFSFDKPARIDDRNLYVVNFEGINKQVPWYYGKLFIDAASNSLVKAVFSLNVDNRDMASDMFVKKKPGGVRLYPVDVKYEVDYREKDGKWFYGYGNAQLEFLVNWRRKLFNTRYYVNSEMAVTDWQKSELQKIKRDNSFINPNVIIADNISGFADADFWGENNIIEPEKSIESAIQKIQERIQKEN